MRSLQTQLAVGLGLALAVLVVLLLGIGSYSLWQLAEVFVAARLEHDMENLAAALHFDRAGRPLLDAQRINPVFRQPYSGHYYKIRVDTLELRSRSLWDADLVMPPVTGNRVTRRFASGPRQQQLLVVARQFRIQDRPVAIAVTEDFSDLAAGLRRLTLWLALTALLLLGGLIIVQRLLIRRGLRPLETARQDIIRLGRGEIQHLSGPSPREMQPLVEEINRLIVVMEQRLQRSRHALGNLAHALKTPLTILSHLAAQPRVKAQGELCGDLERQTRQIQLLIERELKRARIAGAAAPGQRVVLAGEVDDLIATLRKIHRAKALAIQCRIPTDLAFPGDRDDLLELLGNLLDNACRWAAGTVRLTVTVTAGWQWLTVEDDGPGCAPAELERLTRRGIRIDESQAGHGLGLAIVTAIVEQYDGRIRLGRSAELRGFQVEVALPLPI